MQALLQASIDLPLLHRGKVRDIFAIDESTMLMVTTDRLSAFDVVFDQPIPQKGAVLTSVANYWFDKTEHIIPNHLTGITLEDVLSKSEAEQLEGRAIVVKKLRPIAVEAVVRGYLIGSGWKEYQATGSVCSIELPSDLQLAQQLASPLYTPSSKAAVGEHDVNISFEETENMLGAELANRVKEVSLSIYQFAAEHAFARGVIIADTKFEFGLDEAGQLTLMDEVLTPDSSRFWAKDSYQVGHSPKSYDKQIIRDYLETLDWGKTPPAPTLPDEILQKTAAKYQEVKSILCT
ncbi:MAG TPA: phosphoribosylaminoimidazolesuccinocarboxamide synthase [Candidatus Thioglobus sp.]|jgi:phosphoribosylaminoimidazole-succinocarboxamide synthase|nr:phosphoribosylaminoimidazolesuccinocarboxamide synthase [Candidatus Thioglobus sp.]HIL20922.1 phosphoribosylaminoimidazolesuccinocarboxamide synthase [Candidatus Thioglobus sp.]